MAILKTDILFEGIGRFPRFEKISTARMSATDESSNTAGK
jgi:hypothetical protein